MRLSLGLTTSMPLNESLSLIKVAEKKGYSKVWVGEDLNGRDVFAYLSVLALNTGRIILGSGITSPWVRNVCVIANSTAGLQFLSKGRFILGLGVGSIPEVSVVIGSKPEKVVSRMEEVIHFIRKVFNGGMVSQSAGFIHIKNYSLAVAVKPPKIYLGVRGPKMLALAGRVADGVILSGPVEYLKEAMEIVDVEAEEAGRKPKDVKRVVWNPFILTETEEDVRLAREMVDVMLPSLPPMALKFIEGIKGDQLLHSLSVCGDLDAIRLQLEDYSSMGIEEVVIGPPFGSDPKSVVDIVGGKYGNRS